MMHRLRRYDVFRFAQNDVAPLRSAMMRCLPQCAVRHTSLGVAVIIGGANIICRRQTSFKKRTFVGRQKCFFCWRRRRDSNSRTAFDGYTISNRARSTSYATSPYCSAFFIIMSLRLNYNTTKPDFCQYLFENFFFLYLFSKIYISKNIDNLRQKVYNYEVHFRLCLYIL